MKTISRDEARRLIARHDDLTVIETLSPEYYEDFHLPGAVNVPLDDEFDDNIRRAVPDQDARVLVYCLDSECAASSKAARRMEELGYHEVYDYEAGKVDWREAGLPVE